MKFNLNDKVRVKLTPLGHSIHRANFMKFNDEYFKNAPNSKPAYNPPEEDANGYSVWQLWDLMHEFGFMMNNTMGLENIPMETEIELLDNQDV